MEKLIQKWCFGIFEANIKTRTCARFYPFCEITVRKIDVKPAGKQVYNNVERE